MHHQATKPGTLFFEFEEEDFITFLRKNVDLFSWATSHIPGIDTRAVWHHLAINPLVNPVSQIKCKVGDDKITTNAYMIMKTS